MSISAVLVVKNEEKSLARALKSLNFVDEIIVYDMHSTDQTKAIAKKFTNQVFSTPEDFGYADPARNLALSKAKGDWVLVVDADEEIPKSLANKIKELIKSKETDAFFLPRKNLIFKKAIDHSGWWPDYQVRLFKKGMVHWQDEVHSQPDINGQAEYVAAKPEWAIIHHNYEDIEDFVERSQKYTSLQAKEREALKTVSTQDLLEAFNSEFLRRFFLKKAYQDGMHGWALSLLQSHYELLIKLKQWQAQGFPEEQLSHKQLIKLLKAQRAEFDYWLTDLELSEAGVARKIFLKLKRKIAKR